MNWKVSVKPKAAKQISKLDNVTKKQIDKLFLKLSSHANPRNQGYCLKGELYLWRFRVGDYRLLCEIKDEEITILVIAVGHRKEIYR
jgi:mRNA interferase RelE/StbE